MPRPPHPSLLVALAAAATSLGCLTDINPAYSTGDAASSTTGEPPGTTGPAPECPDGQTAREWWPDEDGDGYGDRNVDPVRACAAPAGMVDREGDCRDDVPEINPAAAEQCNGYDDNCDGPYDGSECGGCVVRLTTSHVYWICPDPGIAWDAARAACTALSAKSSVRLASIRGAAEAAFLEDLVLTNIKADPGGIRHAWIGLEKSDAAPLCGAPDPVADWQWLEGGDPPDGFTDWNPGEPSNMTGTCTCDDDCQERCVELKLQVDSETHHGWNDAPCELEVAGGYVCKTDRDPQLFPG